MNSTRRSTNRPGFRFGIRKILFVTAICAITLCVITFVSRTVSSVLSEVKDTYAVNWASHFVIEHLSTNNNRWPTSWADLRDEYDNAVKRGNTPAVLWEELQDRVEIDWNPELTTSADTAEELDRKFRVIRLSDKSRTSEEVLIEPNLKVLEYLRGREKGVTTQ